LPDRLKVNDAFVKFCLTDNLLQKRFPMTLKMESGGKGDISQRRSLSCMFSDN
jgi:hypothetical protein